MRRNPFIAGILSLLVPGLGQIYGGEGNKGAAVITAAIGKAIGSGLAITHSFVSRHLKKVEGKRDA